MQKRFEGGVASSLFAHIMFNVNENGKNRDKEAFFFQKKKEKKKTSRRMIQGNQQCRDVTDGRRKM